MKTVLKVQLVQVVAVTLLMSVGSNLDSVVLVASSLLDQFKVLVIAFKALNGLVPAYLKHHRFPHDSVLPLRSTNMDLLWFLPPSEVLKLSVDSGKDFFGGGAKLCSSLPNEIWFAALLCSFRNEAF